MKFMLAASLFALSMSSFASPLKSLNCTAKNLYGEAAMVFDAESKTITTDLQGGRKELILANAYYGTSAIMGQKPTISYVSMISPSESVRGLRVTYSMVFRSVPEAGSVQTVKGTLYRYRGYAIPVKSAVATVTCEIEVGR